MTEVKVRAVGEAVEFLSKLAGEVPAAAIVLGSGVKVLENLEDSRSVAFSEVFGLSPGVQGHSGALSLGRVAGTLVVVLRGRFHLYEGYPWDIVTLPTRVLCEWGVPKLFLTNAAGGLNSNFSVGDLMLITGYRDHLNPAYKNTGLVPQLKHAPQACLNGLTNHLVDVAAALNAADSSFRPIQAGVYAGLLGPNYETLAEIEMLKALGSDAVGMSTVPELVTAKGTGTTAAAISVITNVWKPDELIGGHEEVLEAAKMASERLDKLFRAAVA